MGVAMPDQNMAIAVEGVGKVFGHDDDSVEALRNVRLEVARGKTCCVVGPSGCGKTTLLRILLGMEKPTTGEVSVSEAERNRGIAYVQQAPTLLPWRTVLQNASLGLEIRGRLSGPGIEHIAEELVRYGLSGFEHRLADELSGGMKQRVELIRALESRPGLLFCDEPFSAIDFVTRLSLNSRFKKLCKLYAVTTVFVTHNIEEAMFLGDVVVVLSGRPGQVISTYRPSFSIGSEDAVACRESPEFASLFKKIWGDLEEAHATV